MNTRLLKRITLGLAIMMLGFCARAARNVTPEQIYCDIGDYVTVNLDNDDNDPTGKKDYDKSKPVTGEDDLVALELRVDDPTSTNETATLTVSSTYAHVKVWEVFTLPATSANPNPVSTWLPTPIIDTPTTSTHSFGYLTNAPFANRVFLVEGLSPSANTNDVTFTLSTSGGTNATDSTTVIKVDVQNPIDTDADGKVNDFATVANSRTGNAFGYDHATPNVCTIPVRVKIEPDTAAFRTLLADKVTVALDAITHSGFTSALTWDSAVAVNPSIGNLQYDTASALWKATATFSGLPAVPAGSWGRVPEGLRALLYGARFAVVTVTNPSGGGNICVEKASYEVYFGDSLVINGKNMAETTQNYTVHIQALVAAGGVRREIFEKMNCSSETFTFTDDSKAADNFAMRVNMVNNMKKMNATPTQLDVGYCDDGYEIGGVDYDYARAGDTYFEGSPLTYTEGNEWKHTGTDNKDPKFAKKAGVTASQAVQKLYPFRGECAGGMEICWFQSALDVLGTSRFNAVHPGGFGVGLFYGGYEAHVTFVWSENPAAGLTGDGVTLVPGDFLYFKNKNDYSSWSTGLWGGENCVFYGLDAPSVAKFGGLGLSDLTETDLRTYLKNAYEKECAPNVVENPNTQIRFIGIGRTKTGD